MATKKTRALIIVESPSKAKKIATYVPGDVAVMASVGHIRDLPQFVLGVNTANHFAPNYVVPADKKKVVDDLRKAASKVSTVYLASDPDREGESIAWHLHEVLKDLPGERTFYRVRYNEVTKSAVLNALEHPTAIDQNLVDAQQARRIEDRLSGFKISKLIANAVRGARSAGRVQSVALRLIVDRERAIQDFKPTPYWLLGARLEKGQCCFDARLTSIDGVAPKFSAYGKEIHGIASEADATAALRDLEGHQLTVCAVEKKTLSRRAQPPFITSTLQQAAATQLGYSPDQTMRLAQSLYEEGFITYMRTDGYTVSATIREAVNAEIEKLFGATCVPEKPNVYGNKVKNAQEAHEPIRPTDITKVRLDGVEANQAKLYDLIWRRFMASQMAPAKLERTTLLFEPVEPPQTQHRYRFSASAQKVVFKGFLNVWNDLKDDEEELDAEKLPVLTPGDVLLCREWLCEGKETQPPARFNEASLVHALEENGIGRPSTYAATIRTLLTREYISSGKGHVLTPTEMGIAATDYLLREMPDFVNVAFTAQMEDNLDKVAEGSLNWEQEVADFYAKLTAWLAADPGKVSALLEQMAQIQKWKEPTLTKNGKVSWSDETFFNDMRQAVAEGGSLSKAQLTTLKRMAIAYRAQLPDLERVVGALPKADNQELIQKLFQTIDSGRELNDWEKTFIASTKEQFDRRGDLSQKQLQLLQRIASPEAEEERPQNEDASKALLDALATVTAWNEPVKRGRNIYDDRAFMESLKTQLADRHFLSVRQFDALKRLVRSYQTQIPNYAELAETYAIPAATPRRAGSRTGKSRAKKNAE